jgi:hypothetical protein
MKTKNQSKNRGNCGATLVEMIADVIIVSIVVIGVFQFLIISRLNIYTANIRGGMVQLLSDTIVQNQYIPPGTITNIPVTGDFATYISQDTPYIKVTKSASPTNGTYTVSGTLNWQTFRDGNGDLFKYAEYLSLQIPQ